MTLRVFSYGGGWQSTAALVLAAQGRIDFATFLFANVGDDSEYPATIAYVRQHAIPYARANGIDLRELHRVRRDGTTETLYQRLTREGSRSIDIPVHMANGAPGRRKCTGDFKIKVVSRWVRQHGATAGDPATVGVGISLDEIDRANNRRSGPGEQVVYPLLDLRIRRSDCPRIITSAGLPVPPKSACWFCPFKPAARWQAMRADEPGLFARACDLEDVLIARRASLGKDPVYLTGYGRPLRRVIPETAPLFTEDGSCDGGWCYT